MIPCLDIEPDLHQEFKSQIERIKKETHETESQIAQIKGRINCLEQQAFSAEHIKQNLESFEEHFEKLSSSAKRELLRSVIKGLQVYPSEIKMALQASLPTGPILLTSHTDLCGELKLAGQVGLEPTTRWLTASCSTD